MREEGNVPVASAGIRLPVFSATSPVVASRLVTVMYYNYKTEKTLLNLSTYKGNQTP